MADMREGTTVHLSEISQLLERGVEVTDAARATGLVRLQLLRAAKIRGLQRERARLSARLGANHPRVQALASKIEMNELLTVHLGLEAERAKIDIPVPEETTWTLHGRVLDQDLAGMPRLTVALHDERGKRIEEVKSDRTDSSGYFKLSFHGQKGRDTAKDAATANGESERKGTQAFIHILQDEKVVHIDERPVALELGDVVYREIILGESQRSVSHP
jgi:hypothetical protein